jgi:hypothetical protein
MSLTTSIANINWLAVIVLWIAHAAISLAWFSPAVFGKAWVRLSGKEMKPAVKWIPVGFFAHLVCVFALALLVNLAGATTFMDGLALGLLTSIGFIGAMLGGELVWERIPFRLFLIRIGDQLLTLGLAGAILALWR